MHACILCMHACVLRCLYTAADPAAASNTWKVLLCLGGPGGPFRAGQQVDGGLQRGRPASSRMASAAAVPVDLATLGPGLPEDVEEPDGLTYHLQHLVAVDLSPLELTTELADHTQKTARLFVSKLFHLPRESSSDGISVVLPRPSKVDTFRFPRSLKLPTQKPLTRWEMFAKAKGIQKKKRSRLVWSDEAKDWVPRWGPHSKKALQRAGQAVIEEKGAVSLRGRSSRTKDAAAATAAGKRGSGKRVLAAADAAAAAAAAAAEDPFKKQQKSRELAKAKQKLREVRNAAERETGRGTARSLLQQQQQQGKGDSNLPFLPAGIPTLSDKYKHRNKTKEELKEIMNRALVSTASFGQHDKRPKSQSDLPPQRKRQKPQQYESAAAEAAAYKEQLRLLLATKEANKAHAKD
ncbi:hypothetical protein Efla_007778 [Eimeria flavescens]